MPAAVVNASPLIFLSKLEQLEALRVFRPVFTTRVVLAEVEAGLGTGHRDALAVQRAVKEGRILVRRAAPLSLPALNLDPGELSVLALASRSTGAIAVVDDLPAIKAARHLGLTVRSTPYVLLENVAKGRLGSAEFRTLMEALVRLDYRLSPTLYMALLEESELLRREKG